MGFEESAIGVAKRTVDRLLREGSKLEIPELYMMAAAAMNSHVGQAASVPTSGHSAQVEEFWMINSCSRASVLSMLSTSS